MNINTTSFGTWNGGRFMNYGECLPEEHFISLVQQAYEKGVRTFITADVYGSGAADTLIGRALKGIERDTYALVGIIGHDFYTGQREGSKGFPRFTNPALRSPAEYGSYLKMATEKSLERCGTDRFDLLLLHNPDRTGYTSEAVWEGLAAVRDEGLTRLLGTAPGPANGFSLDLIQNMEKFEEYVDWSMIILNPLEPWPGKFTLNAAAKHQVKLITRVVDYGGIFHDDVRPGHTFAHHDHRSFRPAGWVDEAQAKLEKFRPIAERHGLTPLQFACAWCLSQPAVENVVPTLTQEIGDGVKPIEAKLDELAAVKRVKFSDEDLELIARIGDNTGCMKLKGASTAHDGDDLADNWRLYDDLADVAARWGIDPVRDLAYSH